MPELKLSRSHPAPAPPVCMYCGAPAPHRQESRVTTDPSGTGGGGVTLAALPSGDDPVSGVIGCVMLPVVLWDVLTAVGRRAATPASPPPAHPDVPATVVAITTCDRHRRFADRFVWAGFAAAAGLAAWWVVAVRVVRAEMGGDDVALGTGLMLGAVFATVLLPVALGLWYSLAGQVIVDRVTEDDVTLDRVRRAYFAPAGLSPHAPGRPPVPQA